MGTITAAKTLDRRGKTITTFIVFDATVALRSMQVGQILELLTDDIEPIEKDVAAWSRSVGHRLVGNVATATGRTFAIERGEERTEGGSLAMVISQAGLEELLSPLGFALAGALERMRVDVFVQGPAVRVLARGYRPKLGGWARPFSRFAAAGMARTGHVSAQEKFRQLRSLGATIYVCGPSMEHFKVDREDLIFDDLQIVEYLSFMSVMERSDVQLYV